MRLLHTSDWHLGHLFHGRRREEEFREFLGWLQNVLVEKKINVLLVAGDIFDTNSPGNSCAGMYYDFLAEVVRATGRLRIIIIGGNHDSPSFLNAPAGLLDRAFHIKVFGSAMDDPADEIVTIPGDDGEPAMIIGAVPYLRDGDLHLSSWGESPEEREEAKRTGFREHYRKIAERAEELRAGRPIPFVLTGHFAAAGATMEENDGVREFVGGLKVASVADLPASADYIALGHIHQPQIVGGQKQIRYCGSPLRMSFSDGRRREILFVEFAGRTPEITPIPVPQTREIVTLEGKWEEILPKLTATRDNPAEVCCRVLATDLDSHSLAAGIATLFARTKHNYPLIARSLLPSPVKERKIRDVNELRSLSEEQVFELLLDRRGITAPDARTGLLETYRQLLAELQEREVQP